MQIKNSSFPVKLKTGTGDVLCCDSSPNYQAGRTPTHDREFIFRSERAGVSFIVTQRWPCEILRFKAVQMRKGSAIRGHHHVCIYPRAL